MKRLTTFLTENPSYCKVSKEKVAERLGLALSTVEKFWKTETFKNIRKNYLGTSVKG